MYTPGDGSWNKCAPIGAFLVGKDKRNNKLDIEKCAKSCKENCTAFLHEESSGGGSCLKIEKYCSLDHFNHSFLPPGNHLYVQIFPFCNPGNRFLYSRYYYDFSIDFCFIIGPILTKRSVSNYCKIRGYSVCSLNERLQRGNFFLSIFTERDQVWLKNKNEIMAYEFSNNTFIRIKSLSSIFVSKSPLSNSSYSQPSLWSVCCQKKKDIEYQESIKIILHVQYFNSISLNL